MKNVLFLDDASWRHDEFQRISDHLEDVYVTMTCTAQGAIEALKSEEFDQVFLDHDLALVDSMVPPDGSSTEPTGMDVVRHILDMQRPPKEVIVHSMNGPAAEMMVSRLESHPAGIWVQRIPFHALRDRLHTVLTRRG